MISELSNKIEQNRLLMSLRRFFMSKAGVAVQLFLAILIIVIRGKGRIFGEYYGNTPIVYGILAFAILEALILCVCDNIIASTPAFLFISVISIKCYNSFDVFIEYWWLLFPLVFSLLFHFIVYKKEWHYEKGKLVLPYLLVSAAVTLGGLGKISFKEFFQGTFLFYTVGLGFGMLFIYILLSSCIHTSRDYSLRMRISYTMMAVGILCTFMVFHHYLLYIDTVIEEFRIIYMQWRNNVSTFLMLSMPFAFYISTRDKKHMYFYLGLAEYAAILLSGSRGGAMFGTIEIALCLIVLVYTDKKNRTHNLAVISVAAIIGCTFARTILNFFMPTIKRFFEGDSIREDNIRRAIADFKSNPVFGRGFGRTEMEQEGYIKKTMAVNWYHSSPFQIIGSFGVLGVGTFAYQFYVRFKLLFEKTTHFNLTVFISFLGLTMMSTVNPGEFCPIPYGFIITMFFVICEKCNAATKRLNGDETEENLINIQL